MRRLAPALLLLAACDDGSMGTISPAGPEFASAAPLTLQPVAWNANMTDVGRIAAVSELDTDVVVYGSAGAIVLSGQAVAAEDASVTEWRAAATIPAADATGSWAVGLDDKGRLFRLRARAVLEEITDRYGLVGGGATAVVPMGGASVAFAIPTGIAWADGAQVTRFDLGPLTGLAGGGGRAAGIAADGSVRVFDGAAGKLTVYPTTDAVALAFDLDGKLVVSTTHALWREQGSLMPTLTLLYKDEAALFHGLAVSGGWVWVGIGGDLGGLHDGAFSRTTGLAIPATGTLVSSTSGDAWVLSAGTLARYMFPVSGDEATWRTTVLPVYARVCSDCHAPGGTAGIALASYAQWQAEKAKVYMRVIEKGDMPQGRTLSGTDKAAIANWSKP